MAKTRRRSSAAASVSNDAIESARSTLNELTEKPKEKLSLREAIGELHESITAALDRGYSYEEVVEILSTQGVTITVASLKRYLAAARKEVSDQPKRTRRASRSRQTQLAKQVENLTEAASPEAAHSNTEPSTTDSTSATTAKKRTTSRTKSAAKLATQPTAKTTTKSAAKTKPTSGAKTTSRSTASRSRKRSTASE